jgi:hypothetical protein
MQEARLNKRRIKSQERDNRDSRNELSRHKKRENQDSATESKCKSQEARKEESKLKK